MYKYANGWNFESVMARIKERNHGICFNENEVCQYRHNDNACLIGCFIPDKIYSRRMENKPVNQVLANHTELQRHMPIQEAMGLAEFQSAHDSCANGMDVEKFHSYIDHWLKEHVE